MNQRAVKVGHTMRGAYHLEVLLWVNELVRDLRLSAEGLQPREGISIERLEKWNDLRRRLEEDVVVWEVKL
jgi:hypothetical protein